MTKEKKATSKKTSPASPPKTATKNQLQIEKELAKEVTKLAKQIDKLRDNELLQVYKKPGKFLLLSLLKGIMVGFGTVLGASLLFGVFLYLLTQIQFVPVLGNFVNNILQEIESNQTLIEQSGFQDQLLNPGANTSNLQN